MSGIFSSIIVFGEIAWKFWTTAKLDPTVQLIWPVKREFGVLKQVDTILEKLGASNLNCPVSRTSCGIENYTI